MGQFLTREQILREHAQIKQLLGKGFFFAAAL
jgi:hypothetical protein